MRFLFGMIFVFAACAFAQSEDSPEIARAKSGIEKLRALVEAGAAPRAQLEKAQASLADVEDAAYLRKTVYGSDLTEAQTDDMMAAAERRMRRRESSVADVKKLIAEGVASQLALAPVTEEFDAARKEF